MNDLDAASSSSSDSSASADAAGADRTQALAGGGVLPGPGSSSSSSSSAAACPAGCELSPLTGNLRAEAVRDLRKAIADEEYERGYGAGIAPPAHACNGDEVAYQAQNFIGNFTKGLPHNSCTGEVDPAAYCALLRALASGAAADFEAIPLGCPPVVPPASAGACCDAPRLPQRRLENPQAGLTHEILGADPGSLVMPPPPAFSSVAQVADGLEQYWMALARDVPFTEYNAPAGTATGDLLDAAIADLSLFTAEFYNPGNPFYRTTLSRGTLFRGFSAEDAIGPYVSQFLLVDVPYGAQRIPARIRTLQPGVDYLTSWCEWVNVQNGCDAPQSACDPTPRLIRNGRDLAQFVHVDLDINAFWNAAWHLLSRRDPLSRCEAAAGFGVPFATGRPYINGFAPIEEESPDRTAATPTDKSARQIGIGTFGAQNLLSSLLEAEVRSLRAVWYQKWNVHRRLRPEEWGGRIHRYFSGNPDGYPIDARIATSRLFQPTVGGGAANPYFIPAHNRPRNENRRRDNPNPFSGDRGTYLLPLAFAEGSPVHPSYGAGHATVAGACATILKAFFREDQRILNPVTPNADGTELVAYTGADRGALTVRSEINKLASNISLGRNFGGVHWRSDHTQSLLLGEKIAIALLYDQRKSFNEFRASDYFFQFTRFDGTTVRIDRNTTVADLRGWLA